MNSERIKGNTTSEVQRDQQSENWGRLLFVLNIFLPVAGLFILFRQKHIFSRLLLQLDRNCVSVLCPSFSRREKLLKWAGGRLPETWSSQSRTLAGGVAELWSDGALLCTLINSAVPGACPNPHRHWKKPPLHAQAIAYKYLGVIPIFTENDLTGGLTVSLERSFLRYLNELQQAIVKLSEKNDIPKSISIHYITRGMGLYTGEQHRKTVFYVYPNMNTIGQNSNIIVHISGPYATYGKAVIPKFRNDLFTTPEINVTTELLTTKKLLNGNVMKPRNSFIKNFSLPFMQYHKKHMGDNIVIDVKMEDDRAKVTYIPKNYGMYEIIMISNGELIRGCPFNVHVLNNVSGIEDSFDCEGNIDDLPGLRKRKILSKTIDFIDEQMPVADVLKRYNIKEEHIEIQRHIELTENIKITDSEKKSVDINCDDLIEQQRETPNLTDEEELYSLEKNITSEVDKSNLNLKDIPEKIADSVLEKQNSESTNENCKSGKANGNNLIVDHILNENNQTRGTIHKVNYCADNRSKHKVVNNDVSEGLQLKSATESTSDDKKPADVLDQQQAVFNYAFDANSTKPTSYSSPRTMEVNRIKIPQKFCESQNTSNKGFSDGPHSKYFKNVINTSHKKDVPNGHHKDINVNYTKREINYLYDTGDFSHNEDLKNYDNNNNTDTPSLNNSDEKSNKKNCKIDVEKAKVVPKKFPPLQKYPQNLEPPLASPKNTSPICPNHIVPEVEYRKMSVAEKRKIFAKQTTDRISTSTSSSFSEGENAQGSLKRLNFKHFEGLSVLNYLGSLKKSECSKNQVYPLCSTMSLPNISSMESEIFRNSVKERTNFWEKISSSSSSLSVHSEKPFKKKQQKLMDIERCRLIWRKPEETTTSNNSISTTGENKEVGKSAETRKSADDILSITNFLPHDTPKKYKSMDHSLDKCTMMSIEERKKMLLKQNYEKELPRKPATVLLKVNSIKENPMKLIHEKPDLKNDDQLDDAIFSSIMDRIKKYDNAYNSSNKTEDAKANKKSSNNVVAESIPKNKSDTNTAAVSNNNNNNKDHEDLQDLPQPEILTFKSHFKRAIKYFKNLEEKSLNKSKVNLILKNRRRYSLDNSPNKHRHHNRKGGSLNLENVSQRFSVNNLYEDVFGNKKGIFKGAANRSALVDALATFSRTENRNIRGDEDNIIYEMFRKRAKTKRRKNIKSIFDVYY